jgi:tryptophan synthase alpha chain
MPGLQGSLDEHEVYSIRLVAPTTSKSRMKAILADARGFVYYVSFKGTTGAGRLESDAIAEPVRRIRGNTDLPVAVGFGIKDARSAVSVAQHADGVVIGSALVAQLAQCQTLDDTLVCANKFISGVRSALDEA